MKPRTSRFRVLVKGVWLFLAMFATTSLFLSGCASQTPLPINRGDPKESEILYRLPPGANVALKRGQSEQPAILVDFKSNFRAKSGVCHSHSDDSPRSMAEEVSGAVKFATLAIPAIIYCVADRVVPSWSAGENDVDLQKPTIDAFTKSLGQLRPLSERVQDYARGRGLEKLAVVPDEATQSPPVQPLGGETPDYLIEIAVINVEIRSRQNDYWLGVTGRGRLIRAHDKLVVDEFATQPEWTWKTLASWTPETASLLYAELDPTLNTLAASLLTNWVEPIVKGSR